MKPLAVGLLLLTTLLASCERKSSGKAEANADAQTGITAKGMRNISKLAVISYWQAPDYAKLPPNSVALINPNSGIKGVDDATIASYQEIVKNAVANKVNLLAYVPMGYGERDSTKKNSSGTQGQSMADIKAQVDQYAKAFGAENLYGIFFDEADQTCESAKADYAELSQYVRAKGMKVAAWNPGWVGDDYCFVKATPAGDIVTTFEDSLKNYREGEDIEAQILEGNRLAHEKGALTWNLIHTAPGDAGLKEALELIRNRQTDYAYVTDLRDWTTGDNTWGKPPSYWKAEAACLIFEQGCP